MRTSPIVIALVILVPFIAFVYVLDVIFILPLYNDYATTIKHAFDGLTSSHHSNTNINFLNISDIHSIHPDLVGITTYTDDKEKNATAFKDTEKVVESMRNKYFKQNGNQCGYMHALNPNSDFNSNEYELLNP